MLHCTCKFFGILCAQTPVSCCFLLQPIARQAPPGSAGKKSKKGKQAKEVGMCSSSQESSKEDIQLVGLLSIMGHLALNEVRCHAGTTDRGVGGNLRV